MRSGSIVIATQARGESVVIEPEFCLLPGVKARALQPPHPWEPEACFILTHPDMPPARVLWPSGRIKEVTFGEETE